MYLAFEPKWRDELLDIEHKLKLWAERYNVRYTTKFIKGVFRVGFDHDKDFTLFTMTWAHDFEEIPYLNYKIVRVQNEKY